MGLHVQKRKFKGEAVQKIRVKWKQTDGQTGRCRLLTVTAADAVVVS